MVVEELIGNVSGVVAALPPEIIDKVGSLLTILKAVGILFIIYVGYLLMSAILNWKKYGRLKRIEKKLVGLERKLDKVLKKKK